MKRALLCLLMMSSIVFADDARFIDVTGSNMVAIPARIPMRQGAPAWVTASSSAQGTYITSSNMIFMVSKTTNDLNNIPHGPTHSQGEVTTNGITFLNIPKVKRTAYYINNAGTDTVWYVFGKYLATTNSPLTIAPGATLSMQGADLDTLLQYELNMIGRDLAQTNLVRIQEL